jgi:hypothetical protein
MVFLVGKYVIGILILNALQLTFKYEDENLIYLRIPLNNLSSIWFKNYWKIFIYCK